MEKTDTYTLKEVVESNFKEVHTHLNDLKVLGTDTSVKVGIQNGRVTKLETVSNELVKFTENNARGIQSLKNTRTQIWSAITVLVFLGGTIIFLAVLAIDTKIQKGIDTAFNNKFDHIEVTNNYGKTVNK